MKFTYVLAPIEDMTSNAFRTLCFKYGADLTFTELIRVEGLAKKNECTWSRLDFHDSTPTVIQLLGAKESCFRKFLDMFKPSDGFKGFNLNLGCPSPRIIELGQGCAMVRRISKTKKIVSILRGRGYDVSIKMRLGINERDRQYKSYLHLLDAVDADFFVVHPRYGNETYDTAADFSVYEECAKTGRTIIANGDIKAKEQIDYLKSAGVKGAMIGREAILDPCIFNTLKGIECRPADIVKEYISLTEKYNEPYRYRKNILKRIGK